jgi:biotin-[acetyl-CoA-carboxylase] ligase BirA-like protein
MLRVIRHSDSILRPFLSSRRFMNVLVYCDPSASTVNGSLATQIRQCLPFHDVQTVDLKLLESCLWQSTTSLVMTIHPSSIACNTVSLPWHSSLHNFASSGNGWWLHVRPGPEIQKPVRIGGSIMEIGLPTLSMDGTSLIKQSIADLTGWTVFDPRSVPVLSTQWTASGSSQSKVELLANALDKVFSSSRDDGGNWTIGSKLSGDGLPYHVQLSTAGDSCPFFSFHKYFDHLRQLGSKYMGTTCLHAETVTSTQTWLDSNSTLLNQLPEGFVFIANNQTQGRGRSGNHWVSSNGCLQFSLVVRHPHRFERLVFLQYLMALAIVKGIRASYQPHSFPVFIKWPNDIYAMDMPIDSCRRDFDRYMRDGQMKKIGGVLVNTSMRFGNEMNVIIGCGLNVLNARPTISLRQIADLLCPSTETNLETILASILSTFDDMYSTFLDDGFQPTLAEYYQYWLHSNQEVCLNNFADSKVPVQARICGITPDGFLQAIDIHDSNQTYELQPDGNRFDLMQSMIVKKAQL